MTEFSHITIRLTPEQFAWLAERKKSTGTTFASQLRLLIEDARRLEHDLADIAARKPQHDAAILALLEKEPEPAVHFQATCLSRKLTQLAAVDASLFRARYLKSNSTQK